MFGLLYKDLMVLKKDLIVGIVGMLFFSIPLLAPWTKLLGEQGMESDSLTVRMMIYVFMPLFGYFCIFTLISMIQGSLFAQDERKVWSSYICASPLGARGQVLSKYYMTIALSFTGYVWGRVCDLISGAVNGVQGSAMTIYTALFFIQIFLRSFEMPFLIRYGEKNGKTYKILIMAGVIFIGIVYALFGKLPEFASFDECMDYIIKVVESPQTLSTASFGVVSIFPYVAILCYYLSYKISCRLYQKGVESYDA